MLIEAIPIGSKYPLRFEISPRELLEQIPHTQIKELLSMINLPQQPAVDYCKCENPNREIGVYNYKGNFEHYLKDVCSLCYKLLPPKPKQEPKR